MLQILGVELCGEPLHWDDVRPFIKRFEEMDVSKRGVIGQDDLDAIYQVRSACDFNSATSALRDQLCCLFYPYTFPLPYPYLPHLTPPGRGQGAREADEADRLVRSDITPARGV